MDTRTSPIRLRITQLREELQRQGVNVIGSQLEEDRADADGFTEALDPDRELGELPTEDEAGE